MTVQNKLQQMKQNDSKNLFKLKKFQTVGPRTNSYSRQGIFSEKSKIVESKIQDEKAKFPPLEENKPME